jgi:hypothetical protein
MKLIWQKRDCSIFGSSLDLVGLREGESGCARKHGKRYIAMAFINGRYLSHCAGTLKSAINHLEKDIDKRSIGLFGVDNISFEIQK